MPSTIGHVKKALNKIDKTLLHEAYIYFFGGEEGHIFLGGECQASHLALREEKKA